MPDWQVQLRDTPEDVFHWHGPGVGFSPELGNRSGLSSAACTIFSDVPPFPWPWVPPVGPIPSCDDEVKKAKLRAWRTANFRLRTMVTRALTPRVRQLLTYDAPPGSPFATKPVGPGCLVNDGACATRIQQHLLPASLAYMAFSWFAEPFRPASDGRPQDQYPIWRVDKRCPQGAREHTGVGMFPGVASNGMLEQGDCYACPPGWVGDCAGTPSDVIKAAESEPVLASEPSPVGAPAPRTGFAGVYSRANERIFLVGGEDAITGEPMRDLWWRALDGTRWYRVPASSYAPEKVLAATFSYRDRRVWVLDEVRHGWSRKARLTRVDPTTGEAEVIGTWPRIRRFDKHWLVLDRDGSILLVASSSKLHRHVVARIRNDGDEPQLDGIRLAPRPLAYAPGVDARGYSFVVWHGKKLRVKRMATLDAKPGHWFELGECL